MRVREDTRVREDEDTRVREDEDTRVRESMWGWINMFYINEHILIVIHLF